MNSPIAVAGLTFLTTLTLTPLVRFCAIRLGVVDRPDGRRKLHSRAIPLGGGVAIFCGLAIAAGVLLLGPASGRQILDQHHHFLIGLALSSFVICTVGIVDDRIGLRGRHKLAGQIAAAGILIFFGFHVQTIQFFGWEVSLGLLAIPFTLMWLLGTVNALNLIDGMDGLATSVGIIMSLAIAGASTLQGNAFDASLALMMCGGLLAFLYFNFSPARMFLGDAGSMLIGLTLGVLAIRCSAGTSGSVALFIPVALWAIPFFDVGIAILRRKLTGRSIFSTDRGHLHHVLLQRGYSCRAALLAISLRCAAVAVGAIAGVVYENDLIAAASVVGVTGSMVATRLFGTAECGLLARRLKAFLYSFLLMPDASNGHTRQICTHLQGTQRWDDLWTTLVAYGERFDLTALHLNVNVPSIHEEYHASWNRKASHDPSRLCETQLPLMANDRTVGRVRIIAEPVHRDSICGWMQELIDGLKPVESQLLSLLVASPQSNPTASRPGKDPVAPKRPGRRAARTAKTFLPQPLALTGIDSIAP